MGNNSNNIFDRINRNVAQLTPQELRHAKFSGAFITTVEELAEWMFDIFPRNFPRIADKSRRQMKDVELIAQLLLMIEEGAKGYSSEELDKAFSDRDSEWEDGSVVVEKFRNAAESLLEILQKDTENFIIRSRFRNQADFYSLFGVIVQLSDVTELPEPGIIIRKLQEFITAVEDEEQRGENKEIEQYYEYIRTAS
ncbi:MAG: DUF262 domain-containing protein, partial [Bacteroidetes bacterium]|nr:DUF262 domain-containing protein [Bacteroidota bacterium]